MSLPLEGVRVLAISQYGAGPWTTMHLADLGAEIIKIEDPLTGGDVARYVPPYHGDRDSIYFQSFNRNKKSITLNLRSETGKELFHDLVRTSDAVFNNLRGDVPAKLGIDYAGLQAINPKIVCCSLSAFGRDNSRSTEPGYDYIMQAYAGWMSITGEPDGPPAKSGLSLVDLSAGAMAAFGMVSAIMKARETGKGCDVDVSLFDAAFSLLAYVGSWHLSRGYEPERTGHSAHPSQVPAQIFQTADGWVAVMCAKEVFWRNLCDAAGHPELIEDPRFLTFSDRLEHRKELTAILDEIFLARTTGEWLDLFRGKLPCGPVNTVPQALQDPLVVENELIVEIEHPEFGVIRQLATAVKIGGAKKEHHRAPALGEHTDEILQSVLGLTSDQVAALREQGAV
jgi:crotonobetainyl-CoA:carnitine CoA-transferase CaiB-like acyl-CoA transferase